MPENNRDEIQEHITQMMMAAVTLHEAFLSFVDAGFTESQAITLVASLLNGAAKGGE